MPEKVTEIQRKPNILLIMGDDIGWFNISAYNHGIMGYRTPNIDRLAVEGAMFTDWYGQQSCTAGRAAFITGQSPIRTGLTKVGLPGAELGIQPEDPTIAAPSERPFPSQYVCTMVLLLQRAACRRKHDTACMVAGAVPGR